jgi:hypothetical protein
MNNLKFKLLQIGTKAAREYPTSMLLESSELPSDSWKILDERKLRIGFSGHLNEATRRARHAGRFLAIRSFEHLDRSRWLWVEVIPLVSEEDAQSMLCDLESRFLPNPRAKTKIIGSRKLDTKVVPDISHYPFAYEQSGVNKQVLVTTRYLAGTIYHVIFIVACTAFDGGWRWSQVASVARLQEQKVERILHGDRQS